jgi:glutamate-1-semialdehyde 2,1-aminomutase
MVFSRMFGKKDDGDAVPASPEMERDDVEDATDAVAFEDSEKSLGERARSILVGGASTGSKRVDAMYGESDIDAPTHFVRASGCHVQTADGETLVDCTMALGSVALGYAEPQVTRAVIEAIAAGTVSGLSPVLEVEVAERLRGVIPCAERVQFLKSGADAMSAAVRIARTYTGRDVVVGCGYFGWHDWCSESAGVPSATRGDFRRVPFDDTAALEKAVADAGSSLAAVVLEPVIERLPAREWVTRARELCDDSGAALVFDEMKTGFRIATGGYQQYADVTPDIAAFGKAMANGHPIAAVCGLSELMDAGEKTWISSTLASETGALAAIAGVLAWHERADVCASLWSIGKEMRDAVSVALEASGVEGVWMDGIDPMWLLRFDESERESVFLSAAVRNGVLFKRGAYNYAALAHDEDALRDIEAAASAAFVELREFDEQ